MPLNLVLIKKNQQSHSRSQYWSDNEAAPANGGFLNKANSWWSLCYPLNERLTVNKTLQVIFIKCSKLTDCDMTVRITCRERHCWVWQCSGIYSLVLSANMYPRTEKHATHILRYFYSHMPVTQTNTYVTHADAHVNSTPLPCD